MTGTCNCPGVSSLQTTIEPMDAMATQDCVLEDDLRGGTKAAVPPLVK
jgi:hypothetical protein